MLFNSLEFAIFFPVVTVLFYLFPHRLRWLLLLAASCFFYMFFKPVFILILLFTIVIDYFAGIWIARTEDKKRKRWLLILSIFANVGVLVVFKYYNFIADNFNIVLRSIHANGSIPILNILLPIGLSFHTLQAMSYTVEVYKGKQAPEKHLGIYALYVMFYPQLVAGPIERPQNLLHQFHEEKKFNYDNVRKGLILIAWGLFKKVVIADRLAFFVNHVYGNPFHYSGIPLIMGMLFFSFQIFCDFSGYSDIALGSAKCMGFDITNNFDRPYMATSLRDFWRRWHISLSTWFRDYVYIPLGGSQVPRARYCINILIVFLLSGLWHGANWTFIIWGLLHGFYLLAEYGFYHRFYQLKMASGGMASFVKRVFVFILVSLAWVFFRAPNVSHAFYILKHSLVDIPHQIKLITGNENDSRLTLLYLNQPRREFIIAIIFIFVLIIVHYAQKKHRIDEWIVGKHAYVRWSFYYVLVLSFIIFGIFNRSAFIYFQF